MIIDTSAVLAILLDEPDRPRFVDRIWSVDAPKMSSATLLEVHVVMHRKLGDTGLAQARRFFQETPVEIVPFTAVHAQLAIQAYRQFGKGMGHPAQLNILDCCTYALAAEAGEPILFKGADFDKTGIPVVA